MTDQIWHGIAAASSEVRSEAEVEDRIVRPLLAALGYSIQDVVPKQAVRFQRGKRGRPHEADYVVYIGSPHGPNTSGILIEAKSPSEQLEEARAQAESYNLDVCAPFIMLCNGNGAEIWAVKPFSENEMVIRFSIADIALVSGEVEALLSRQAVSAYRQSLLQAPRIEITRSFAPYIDAEHGRLSDCPYHATRLLADLRTQSQILSSELLLNMPAGAIFTASSGFGKTSLGKHLHRTAIASRKEQNGTTVSVEVDLSDLATTEQSLLEYCHNRIECHCPSISISYFRQELRLHGITIVCDSLDRIPPNKRNGIAAQLREVKRDYPKTQLFVLTRTATRLDLDLPILELKELSLEQQGAVCDDLLGPDKRFAFSRLPSILGRFCGHPLLLTLVLKQLRSTDTFTVNLAELFGTWLSDMLNSLNRDPAFVVLAEQALTSLAAAESGGTLSKVQAFEIVRSLGLPSTIFDYLVECDALRLEAHSVSLVHEAMADYLRARLICSRQSVEVYAAIDTLSLDSKSLLAALLMALLKEHSQKEYLFRKLASTDWDLYLAALTFRSDTSDEFDSRSSETSEMYLKDLKNGFIDTVEGFFPDLRAELTHDISGDTSDRLCIVGQFTHSMQIIYGFGARANDDQEIVVGFPTHLARYRMTNLQTSGLRIDSGRLLGLRLTAEAIESLIESRKVRGSTTWIRELVLSRFNLLVHQRVFDYASTRFEDIVLQLLPHRHKQVTAFWGRNDKTFEVSSFLNDIRHLQDAGDTEIDVWWLRHGWQRDVEESFDVLRNLMSETYRRATLIYRELVEGSFSKLTTHFGLYNSLPVKWYIEIPDQGKSKWVGTRFRPAISWNHADPEVIACDKLSSFDNELLRQDYAELERMRGQQRILRSWRSYGVRPNFHGANANGQTDGETAAIRLACHWLSAELRNLLNNIPRRDTFQPS